MIVPVSQTIYDMESDIETTIALAKTHGPAPAPVASKEP
jgi:hypothetical protein